MPELQTKSPKTFMECVKQDRVDLDQIQKDLDLAIGRDMKGVVGKIHYRSHVFEVELLGKIKEDGSLC